MNLNKLIYFGIVWYSLSPFLVGSQIITTPENNMDSLTFEENHSHQSLNVSDYFAQIDDFFRDCLNDEFTQCKQTADTLSYFRQLHFDFEIAQKLFYTKTETDTLYAHSKLDGNKAHDAYWREASSNDNTIAVRRVIRMKEKSEDFYIDYQIRKQKEELKVQSLGLYSFDNGNLLTFFSGQESLPYIKNHNCDEDYLITYRETDIVVKGKAGGQSKKRIRIFDALGKEIKLAENTFYSGEFLVAMPSLGAGIYFLVIEESNCSSSSKFVVL